MKDRMKEYVEYHINGDADCNDVLLKKWADDNNLSQQERYDLAYFFAITYSIPSGIILLKEKDLMLQDIDKWVAENKSKLIFQSDRKYVRMLDNFNGCIKFYKDNLQSVEAFLCGITAGKTLIIEKALQKVEKWFFFGRFSAFLFLETFTALTDFAIENTTIDWKNGDTATSGLMNLFGLDNSANYFDKTGKIPDNLDYNKMNNMLLITLKEIKKHGGDDNVTGVETSLCAYRKFFKGSRYNGFYLDRMLEEIIAIKKFNPKYSQMADDLLRLRKSLFNEKYLGELNNWNGIRKDCKKLYKEKGVVL